MGSYENRCGGRGFRVFAGRIPAASDLVGIYEDVGAMLITLSTSIVHSFRLSTSVSRGSAISAIRTSPECFPFERKIFPPVSSTYGNHHNAGKGVREDSTTEHATYPGQDKTFGAARVVRTTSFQFERTMRGQGFRGAKYACN